MSNPGNHQKLLPIVVQENTVPVDAKLLHQKLQVKTRFNDWFKRRVEQYGFDENKDFYSILSKSTGGRKSEEFLLSLDMAKELAMLEENETGRHVRRYFIEKEKELRAISHLPEQTELFQGLLPSSINGHQLYHYKTILERAGYSTKSSSSRRRHSYAGHFVQVGKDWFITQAFASHLHH